MRSRTVKAFVAALLVLAACAPSAQRGGERDLPRRQASDARVDDWSGLRAVQPIDAHTHVFGVDDRVMSLIETVDMRFLDIEYLPSNDAALFLRTHANAKDIVDKHRDRAALCVTFNPYAFGSPTFAKDVVTGLERAFAEGAIAVKIWKTVGMDLTRPDGSFVMPDDPAFEPIYSVIARRGRTLISHAAEPDSCWEAPNPASPDHEYYDQHPEWYMYGRSDHPSKEAILRARDHMIASHPDLRIVLAHLGSLETRLDELAVTLDKYPNIAVDTASRMGYLTRQPPETARAFLMKYQDRVIYGSDLDWRRGASVWRARYAGDWKYLATDDVFVYDDREVRGLRLPPEVVRKIYRGNALHWLPGIVRAD